MRTLAVKSNTHETSTQRVGGNYSHKQGHNPVKVSALPGGSSFLQTLQCSCDGGCPVCTGIQPKLTIGQPNDKYEQEADRVAGQVMCMPEPGIQRQSECSGPTCSDEEEQIQTKPIGHQFTPLIQRQADPELDEEEEEEKLIQTKKAKDAAPEVTPAISSGIRSLQGGGQPLSSTEQSFFEPRFGANFSNVRVHNDTHAANLARSVNARAFTFGHNVMFGAGEYFPGRLSSRRLLAHELTHVVQQGGATIQKASDDKGLATAPDEMGEHDMKHRAQQEASANIHSADRLGIKASVPDDSASLQRVADKSNPPTNTACDRVYTGPGAPGGTHIDFGQSEKTLNPTHRELIEAEFASWHSRGRIDRITVHGFASSEGPPGINWDLSCNRAEVVKAEFVRLGVPEGMVTTIAHGETEEFSRTELPPNRRAVIRIVPTPRSIPIPGCPSRITANTTLTTDCTNGIVIAADNIVLDGAGYTLTGPGTGNGILLRGRRGVRIVNLHVTNFNNGIALRNSHANTFTNNSSFRNDTDGVDMNDSNDNIFIQNDVSNNRDHGIELDGSSDNSFIQNTVNGNGDGFDTEGPPRGGPPAPSNIFIRNNANNNRGAGFRILSNANIIKSNSSNNNEDGFRIQGNDNELSEKNSGSKNTRDGFLIQGNDNTLSGNSGSNNTWDGFRIEGNNNTLSGNTGNKNQSQDVDVRNNTTGNTCTGNTFGTTNGQCPPDIP
jgi:parallel beta-helix repeat protein